jgi:hypothetical protein
MVGDAHLREVSVIWLVSRQAKIFDPHGDLPAALERARIAGPAQDWGYIRVQPYIRR